MGEEGDNIYARRAVDRTILGSVTESHHELTEKMLKKYKKEK